MITRSKTIHRLLSLVLCLCMVLTLLPMIPMEAEAASQPEYLYLKLNSGWPSDNARFAAYFFDNGETWVSGNKISNSLYEFKVPTDKTYPKVIFCRMNPSASDNNWDNKWNQTGDLTVPTNGNNLFTLPNNSWNGATTTWGKQNLCDVDRHNFGTNGCNSCGVGYMTIYFENNWLWSDVQLYYWYREGNENATHPGRPMTFHDNNGEHDFYVMKVPTDVKGIQFNGIKDDGSGIRDQVDITSGWKNNLCYRMLSVNNSNTVETFDISTVKFPCKHKNVVDVAGTDATCTATGLTAGTKCADCGEPIQAQDVIPALGHKWSNATCDAPKTCSVCGATEGAALGHKWDDATCDAPKTCSVCKATEGAALGHKWDDATCDTPKTCSVCKVTEGEALGHSYVRECDTNCSVCGQLTRPDAAHVSNAYACCEGICVYGCGTVMPASAAHTYQNDCDADCDVCGEPREVGEHTYANGCDVDCNICGEEREVGDHLYFHDCDSVCYECGEETRVGAPHVSNALACRDGVCQYGCGTVMPATAEHTYDNACDATCNICGQGRLPAEHQYECIFMQDPTCGQEGIERYHCTVCGDTYEMSSAPTGEHQYYYGCDTNCFICDQETRPEAVHVSNYSYPCRDGVCKYGCGTEMPATEEHIYDNACDTYCNTCNIYRDVPGHVYDNVCDNDCNICGFVPGVPGHSYDNECDAECNNCGTIREVGSHRYYYLCDTYCYECNQLTRPEAVHVSDAAACKAGACQYCRIEMPATGDHSWYITFAQDPTCGLEGIYQYHCYNCEATYEERPAATGKHNYQCAFEQAPTCESSGAYYYQCLSCGHGYEEYPAALGHSYTAKVTEPTCTEQGYTTNTCGNCGNSYIDNYVDSLGHADADKNYRCDSCNKLMQDAQLAKVSVSLKGNIAVNYYMLLSDEVAADRNAYMYFKLVDGEVKIPATDGVKMVLDGETYYVYTCAVDAKEMTDNIVSQFFYGNNVTREHTYNVQTYGKHILAAYDDQATRDLITAMLNYGAASQLHFGYNTDKLANDVRDDKGNALIAAPDYSNVTIDGFQAVAGQGTELAKFYSASLILKSETTVRFFFQVNADATFTASYNGQELTVSKRGSLHYVDVVGISAKDLDEAVTITINDGTNTTEVSFNPMSYCQGVLNDTTGAFSNEMKDLVRALYLYNQAANVYFKEV